MKPSEVIDEMLTTHIPDADHWLQGDLEDEGRYCMLGALNMATLFSSRNFEARRQVRTKVVEELGSAITEFDPGTVQIARMRDEVGLFASIPHFNDQRGRTYDEVRAVMEKARAGLQERGE